MAQPIKILTFAGSTRSDSINKKLAKLSSKIIQEAKIQSQFIDLRDYPLPLYDGDDEMNKPYPENALQLKHILKEHDGFLIASPEYNSSITAVLKNALDWVSRSVDKGTDLSPFSGKVVALVSASPGNLGGLRGLIHIRSILSNIGCFVIPNQMALPQSYSAFDENGHFKDAEKKQQLSNVLDTLIETTKRFKVDLDLYCNQIFGDFCAKQMA